MILYGREALRELYRSKFTERYDRMIELEPIDDIMIAHWAYHYIIELEKKLEELRVEKPERPKIERI